MPTYEQNERTVGAVAELANAAEPGSLVPVRREELLLVVALAVLGLDIVDDVQSRTPGDP